MSRYELLKNETMLINYLKLSFGLMTEIRSSRSSMCWDCRWALLYFLFCGHSRNRNLRVISSYVNTKRYSEFYSIGVGPMTVVRAGDN